MADFPSIRQQLYWRQSFHIVDKLCFWWWLSKRLNYSTLHICNFMWEEEKVSGVSELMLHVAVPSSRNQRFLGVWLCTAYRVIRREVVIKEKKCCCLALSLRQPCRKQWQLFVCNYLTGCLFGQRLRVHLWVEHFLFVQKFKRRYLSLKKRLRRTLFLIHLWVSL